VGNSVKGLTKVQVDDIHSLSLIHQVDHLVIEGDQVGQAGPVFHEPMLSGPIPWLSFTRLVNALRMNHSIILPGTEVRLTGL